MAVRLEGWGSIALPGNFKWFSNYWWIPIVGPFIGGIVGSQVYERLIAPVIKARSGATEEGHVPAGTQGSHDGGAGASPGTGV